MRAHILGGFLRARSRQPLCRMRLDAGACAAGWCFARAALRSAASRVPRACTSCTWRCMSCIINSNPARPAPRDWHRGRWPSARWTPPARLRPSVQQGYLPPRELQKVRFCHRMRTRLVTPQHSDGGSTHRVFGAGGLTGTVGWLGVGAVGAVPLWRRNLASHSTHLKWARLPFTLFSDARDAMST